MPSQDESEGQPSALAEHVDVRNPFEQIGVDTLTLQAWTEDLCRRGPGRRETSTAGQLVPQPA